MKLTAFEAAPLESDMKRPAHHPEYLRQIHLLEPLLRQYRPLATLEFDDIADWVAWYWNRGHFAMSWTILTSRKGSV